MAHPKRRTSKSRKKKRRTHYKLKINNFSICSKTKEMYISHRAFWHEDKLYYKGKVILEKNIEKIK